MKNIRLGSAICSLSHIKVTDLLPQIRDSTAPARQPGRVLLGILGGGVPPDSPNPDPISD